MQQPEGERFQDGDGIDLHASDLPRQRVIEAIIEAKEAAERASAETGRENLVHSRAEQIAAVSHRLIKLRAEEVERANRQQAA